MSKCNFGLKIDVYCMQSLNFYLLTMVGKHTIKADVTKLWELVNLCNQCLQKQLHLLSVML